MITVSLSQGLILYVVMSREFQHIHVYRFTHNQRNLSNEDDDISACTYFALEGRAIVE